MKTNGTAFQEKRNAYSSIIKMSNYIYKQEHSLPLTDVKQISYFIVPQVFTEEAEILLKNAFLNSVFKTDKL